jgi:hypothetical protein
MLNIVSIQLLIYLFISPALASLLVGDYKPLLFIPVVFVSAFFVGVMLAARTQAPATYEMPALTISKRFFIGYAFFSLSYIFVVIQNGLIFRRQGSEVMADLYSSIPLHSLLILRLFEIVYWPIMISTLYFFRKRNFRFGGLYFLCLVPAISAFFFTGVLDSRSKFILPIIFMYIVFRHDNFIRSRMTPIKLILLVFIMFLAFFTVAVSRVGAYGSILDWILIEFIQRTDGLELLSRVSSEIGSIPLFGTRDPLIFLNFVAMIPFLDQAIELKALGLTSSKMYLLTQVLGSTKIDINNSILTDPYYFAGVFGLIIVGVIYGYFVRKVDNLTKVGGIWRTRWVSACGFAFVLNAWRFESDLFGLLFVITRDIVIFYILFTFLTSRRYEARRNLLDRKKNMRPDAGEL